MGAAPLGEAELGARLADLAGALPPAAGSTAGRRDAVRQRVRVLRRRRAAVGALTAGASLASFALLAPLLTTGSPDRDRPVLQEDRRRGVVATFDFPDQGAVAEVLLPDGPVRVGVPARYVVRVRTERGRVGGVDLTFGDGRATYLDGVPTCTPDAGPTVVEVSAEHAFGAPGRFTVRARPQLLTGCRDGRGVRVPGGTPGEAVVEVG